MGCNLKGFQAESRMVPTATVVKFEIDGMSMSGRRQ